MEYVLDKTTRTLHKQERGATGLQAECGATYHLDPGQLQTPVAESPADLDASKCGQCFDAGGGY